MLDKIEDTHSQIDIRERYENEKRKQEEENKKSEFKPVEDKSKVVHLGNFGNRKKKPEDLDKTSPLAENKVKGNSPKREPEDHPENVSKTHER